MLPRLAKPHPVGHRLPPLKENVSCGHHAFWILAQKNDRDAIKGVIDSSKMLLRGSEVCNDTSREVSLNAAEIESRLILTEFRT